MLDYKWEGRLETSKITRNAGEELFFPDESRYCIHQQHTAEETGMCKELVSGSAGTRAIWLKENGCDKLDIQEGRDD